MSKNGEGKSSSNTRESTGQRGEESSGSLDKGRSLSEDDILFRVQFLEPVGNAQYADAKSVLMVESDGVLVGMGPDTYFVPMANVRYVHYRKVEKDEKNK